MPQLRIAPKKMHKKLGPIKRALRAPVRRLRKPLLAEYQRDRTIVRKLKNDIDPLREKYKNDATPLTAGGYRDLNHLAVLRSILRNRTNDLSRSERSLKHSKKAKVLGKLRRITARPGAMQRLERIREFRRRQSQE